MMRPSHIATLCSLLVLGACMFPYVGRNRDSGIPCVDMGVWLPYANTLEDSYGGGDCPSFTEYARAQRDAEPSTKHVLYTEAQRLAMAEAALRALYPIERYRFRFTNFLAEQAISSYVYTLGMYMHDDYCNAMLAQKNMATALEPRLPEQLIYQGAATSLSKRYSDKQILAIHQAATTTGITPELDKTLGNQGRLSEWPHDPYMAIYDYEEAHRDALRAEAANFYTAAVAQKIYSPKEKCSTKRTDALEHYELERQPN